MSSPLRHESSGRFPLFTPLKVTIERSGSTRLLRIAGELDMATAGQVQAALDRLDLDAATLVILDLRELDFLDVAGLKTILRADHCCRSHQARLTVIKPRGFAGRLFTLTRAHCELDLTDPPARGWAGLEEIASTT